MKTRNRAVRAGLVAFTLAVGLLPVDGLAAADVPLEPAAPSPVEVAWEGATGPGSSDALLGPAIGSALGSSSLSSTGSRNAGLLDLPMALGYVPCNPAKSSALGTLVAGLIEITGSMAYGITCPPPTT